MKKAEIRQKLEEIRKNIAARHDDEFQDDTDWMNHYNSVLNNVDWSLQILIEEL